VLKGRDGKMAVLIREPFAQMYDLQRAMNRLFNDSLRGAETRTGYPLVNIAETDNELVVEAEIPGITIEDVRLTVVGDHLSITGERKSDEIKDAKCYLNERSFGQFQRVIELPVAIDSAKIKATYRNGVLKVVLPKAEAAKPKQIKVEVA
jgi:HSP20 family protein